ncbi:hypothetical protein RJT34_07693 [Clitoria ternatea]|uniref:F-box domain-containing protein n=1 Tax=Clitoria ternatea TaxID=43366 RepID=A0AAN9PTN4_CLITE
MNWYFHRFNDWSDSENIVKLHKELSTSNLTVVDNGIMVEHGKCCLYLEDWKWPCRMAEVEANGKKEEWSQLGEDLLGKIAENMYSSKDYVRARAVCKEWNHGLSKIPKHIRGPSLVLATEDVGRELELKVPYLRMSELKNSVFRGSCFGWLISVGIDGIVQVLNP